ncbi:hypothetical protein LTR56_024764 [Elasticomyces elasticus]|nr:hypothetical protein LTR56_024764 [Elasticomyces elasticus]KAK3635072.1 hypothetical protein LTR22_019352 [Elasticomyces elasticus]KAK4900447.1 hypothetical protein LTR49_027459 [Elasticomyces elasticus]KAK5759408.1 hypothetical protein LTS12_010421 [Elasticomyces elasticus]
MKTSLTSAALLAALPLGLAQHHYGPPHPGPHSGGPWDRPHPTSWEGHSRPGAPPTATATATSTAPSASASGGSGSNPQSCTPLTTDDIEGMGNNTLFTRWRPQSHFIAPAGWMNDPVNLRENLSESKSFCGPMYDPTRDVYHLFYQWHPQHINWGNISWGYATSKDNMVTWEDHNGWQDSEALAMGPSGDGRTSPTDPLTSSNYDGLGIFSGTAQPVNMQGEQDGTLLLFYTSVSYLPTSWAAFYAPYTETQSLATSIDGGKTFQQYEGNPVINATTNTAPMDWNVTGFRDPFFEPWPALDDLLDVDEPHYYAVFGSGIKGVGPRMPLWTAPASDLTSWSFLGALWEPADNTTLCPILSTGTYGFNFEVSGFFSLPDRNGDLHYFVNMGTEGGNVSFHESAHWALWNEGNVTRRDNGSVAFEPIAGGAGDWGLSYALTSFNDTKHNRRVQWAWAPEDLVGDGGLFSASQQGFQGSLTLPRELFVQEVDGVLNTDSAVSDAKEAVLTPDANGAFTARTLGVRPLPDVVAGITKDATYQAYSKGEYTTSVILQGRGSAHMELKTTISSTTGAAGVIVAASPDMTEYTTIMYEPSNNTILVERLHSSTIIGFANVTVTGYFSPYTIQTSSGTQSETISMDVFVDGSIVEIYVNERFALTTRIYPSMECSTGFGVYVADGGSASFETIEAWTNTANVWPQRPADSSSPLLWDTAAETNNYTWWSGN